MPGVLVYAWVACNTAACHPHPAIPKRTLLGLPSPPLWPQVETVGMGWCKLGAGEGAKAVADMLM